VKYRDGYKYQLAESVIIHTPIKADEPIFTEFLLLTKGGQLQIKSGYAWDGPSGPTWDTDNSLVPSLFHDAIYQLLRKKFLAPFWRPKADAHMDTMLKERGMSWLRRWYWRRGLEIAQGRASLPKNVKKVYEVE